MKKEIKNLKVELVPSSFVNSNRKYTGACKILIDGIEPETVNFIYDKNEPNPHKRIDFDRTPETFDLLDLIEAKGQLLKIITDKENFIKADEEPYNGNAPYWLDL